MAGTPETYTRLQAIPITTIITKATEATKVEREKQLNTLKSDFGRLVINATGKVTGKVLTSDDQDTINKETATQLAN